MGKIFQKDGFKFYFDDRYFWGSNNDGSFIRFQINDPEGISEGENVTYDEIEELYDFFIKNLEILKNSLVGTA